MRHFKKKRLDLEISEMLIMIGNKKGVINEARLIDSMVTVV